MKSPVKPAPKRPKAPPPKSLPPQAGAQQPKPSTAVQGKQATPDQAKKVATAFRR